MKFKFSKYSFIVTGIISFFSFQMTSQELVRPVITGAPFLQIVPDARSGGMGEAGVATLSDNYSQFHNPAKYLFMNEESSGIGLSYMPRFIGYADDIFHAHASYFQKINERSTFSAGLTYFSFGNVVMETESGGQIINQGNFVPNEFALEGSYGLKLNDYFGMTVTARYIRSDITDNQMNAMVQLKTGQAVAADVSGYYNSAPYSHINKWTAGFSLKNVGSKLEYANETGFEYPLPTSLNIGGGYHIANGSNDYISFYAEALKFLVPATDDNRMLPTDNVISGIFNSFTDAPDGFSEEMKEVLFSFGSELSLNDRFHLRTGYITQHRDKGMRNHISAGAGATWENFRFDFAYQWPIVDYMAFRQDRILRFSLSYSFKQARNSNNI